MITWPFTFGHNRALFGFINFNHLFRMCLVLNWRLGRLLLHPSQVQIRTGQESDPCSIPNEQGHGRPLDPHAQRYVDQCQDGQERAKPYMHMVVPWSFVGQAVVLEPISKYQMIHHTQCYLAPQAKRENSADALQ